MSEISSNLMLKDNVVGVKGINREIDREVRRAFKEATDLVYELANALGTNQGPNYEPTFDRHSFGVLTPVNTGRAANSWWIGTQPQYWLWRTNITREDSARPKFSLRNNTLYLTNGVWYMEDLQDGASEQSPRNFIGLAVSEYIPNTIGAFIVENVNTEQAQQFESEIGRPRRVL